LDDSCIKESSVGIAKHALPLSIICKSPSAFPHTTRSSRRASGGPGPPLLRQQQATREAAKSELLTREERAPRGAIASVANRLRRRNSYILKTSLIDQPGSDQDLPSGRTLRKSAWARTRCHEETKRIRIGRQSAPVRKAAETLLVELYVGLTAPRSSAEICGT
jgi:hypothetical protein